MKLAFHSFVSVTGSFLLAFAASGCSTFNSAWKKARVVPATAGDITGRWGGSWRSDKNGHHGKLRCLVTRLDEQHCQARYKATWWKIFRFGYTVTMQAERSDAAFKFHGEADLGWWTGGVYRYDGQATPTDFSSTYKSKFDHGTFQMKRSK